MARRNELEQLPEESSKAYAAAVVYFEMGAQRSQEAVGRKLAKSRTLISRWAAKYQWVERASRYDEHLAHVQHRARERAETVESKKWAKRRSEQREEEYQTAQKLLAKAKQMLEIPLFTVTRTEEEKNGRVMITTVIKPALWRMSDALRFIETATKLARSWNGSATEFPQPRQAGKASLHDHQTEEITEEELKSIINREARANCVPSETKVA